jgi:hypothetical protein
VSQHFSWPKRLPEGLQHRVGKYGVPLGLRNGSGIGPLASPTQGPCRGRVQAHPPQRSRVGDASNPIPDPFLNRRRDNGLLYATHLYRILYRNVRYAVRFRYLQVGSGSVYSTYSVPLHTAYKSALPCPYKPYLSTLDPASNLSLLKRSLAAWSRDPWDQHVPWPKRLL